MELAEKILNRITICKPQKKFLITLFTTILIARGKINFRNLSRYSHYSARTYARQFDKSFNFMALNRAIINDCIDQDQGQDQGQGQDQDQDQESSICTYPGLRCLFYPPNPGTRLMA